MNDPISTHQVLPTESVGGRLLSAGLFLVCGLAVFWVNMTFASQVEREVGWLANAGLAAGLLILALTIRRNNRWKDHAGLLWCFFIASVALPVAACLSDWVMRFFEVKATTPAGMTMAKISDSAPLILLIVVSWLVSRQNLGSLFLQKGDLKQGLILGSAVFVGFCALTLVTGSASPLFKQSLAGGDAGALMKVFPWVLLFALTNGFMEELLFRGLFLKRGEVLLGFPAANVITALVFAAAHIRVNYASNLLFFIPVVFALGLWLGGVMRKTNSLIAPTLIHAGADVMMIWPLFVSMGDKV